MSDMLLIDGDVLAYHSCPPRWQDKVKIEDGIAHKELDEDGKNKEIEFTTVEDQKYMNITWDKFQYKLQDLLNKTFCEEYMMAVGNRDNFRTEMYPDYKGHRVSTNIFVPALRELAVYEGLAVFAENREADDYVRTWATECEEAGRGHIVCSIDKDLRCIPGKYYHMQKEKLEIISEADAKRFYYEQLLMGDPTDKIPGVPGIGPVSAGEFLMYCKTDEEYRREVVNIYKASFDDQWRDYLLSNGKMIHIQRHLKDYFTLEEWGL